MNVIYILMYSMGSVFFVSALAFVYYSLKQVRIMKGATGRRLMAYGACLFIFASAIGTMHDEEVVPPTYRLDLIAMFVWMFALSILVIGSFSAAETVRKVYPFTYLRMVRTFPGAIYYFNGIVVLIFAGIPMYILDIMSPRFNWYGVISVAIWA